MQEITKIVVEEDIILGFMSKQLYFLYSNMHNNETQFRTEKITRLERIETFYKHFYF